MAPLILLLLPLAFNLHNIYLIQLILKNEIFLLEKKCERGESKGGKER